MEKNEISRKTLNHWYENDNWLDETAIFHIFESYFEVHNSRKTTRQWCKLIIPYNFKRTVHVEGYVINQDIGP